MPLLLSNVFALGAAAFCPADPPVDSRSAASQSSPASQSRSASLPSRPDPVALAEQAAFRTALAAIRPSIVKIETVGGAQPVRAEGDGEEARRSTAGFRAADGPTTGVVWSADGWILTSSFNFLRDPAVITVSLADGRRLVARLVARDLPARLALLKVEAADLPAAPWIRPSEVRVGQWSVAAGFGQAAAEPAISVGIVSGALRASGMAVQTDAKISPANYGGPLFDLSGRVIGICVPIAPGEDDELAGVDWYDSGIGFAIHADHVNRRIERLRSGQTLERGLLGVTLDMRDPVEGPPSSQPEVAPAQGPAGMPQMPGLPPASRPARPPDGLLVLAAAPSAEGESTFLAGDVITAVDGAATLRILDFRRALALRAAGDVVEVDLRRGESRLRFPLRLRTAAQLRPSTSSPASAPASASAPSP